MLVGKMEFMMSKNVKIDTNKNKNALYQYLFMKF